FMLSVHYRNPINFDHELLASAKTGLDRIKDTVENLEHRLLNSADLAEDIQDWKEKIEDYRKRFVTEMDDDFNTANAISILFELSKEANLYLQG
ncbi:DALR domain-containing protein, partial [Micrococcus sp. SIMBA_131]